MVRHRIHRLIVVDDKLHVRGVISAMDLLQLLPGVKA
jgi:CBS domain-containing protein